MPSTAAASAAHLAHVVLEGLLLQLAQPLLGGRLSHQRASVLQGPEGGILLLRGGSHARQRHSTAT